MTLLLKDPEAVLDYSTDWGAEYLGDDDLLAGSDWSVAPDEAGGVTIAGNDFDETTSTVKAGGGLPGRVYRLINEIVTASGRADSRSIVLRVELPDLTGETRSTPMLYLAASTPTAGWKPVPVEVRCGAFLTSSRTAKRKAVMGHAATMLTDDGVEVQLTDHDQWLNSCDEEALTGGANLALVGDELLQFADVEPLGAGRFRLTRLRRGLAGTEWALSDHAIGDLFLLIRPGSMQPIALPIRARGSAVTVSQATSGGRTTTTTDPEGREVAAQILAALQLRELAGT